MKKRRRWLIPIIILAVLIIHGIALYFVAPHVIVRPSYNKEAASELQLIELQELFAEKRALNIPLVEDVTIPYAKGNLHGWHLHQSSHTDSNKSDLLLYFGGYNEDSATSTLRFLKQMTDTDHYQGFDIAVVDWPHFGLSEGKLNDNSIRDTSAAIYRYFRSKDNIRRIYLMGYSFGTGPATYVASLYDTDGLILLAPYETAYDLYNSVTPIFYGPMKLLISFQMDEADYARSVSLSPLVVYSLDDDRIPVKYSKALAAHFAMDPVILSLSEVAHDDLVTEEEVLTAIDAYLHK